MTTTRKIVILPKEPTRRAGSTQRCRAELREGDDHKQHRWCTTHQSWFWDDGDILCGVMRIIQ